MLSDLVVFRERLAHPEGSETAMMEQDSADSVWLMEQSNKKCLQKQQVDEINKMCLLVFIASAENDR